MLKVISSPSQIITVSAGKNNCKRGAEMNEINVITDHSIVTENGKIKDIIPNSSLPSVSAEAVIDVSDKVVLPGLVECHTHTAFTGSRAGEFREKVSGVHYEEIARKGGGINYTVQSVRNSSSEEIANTVFPRIDYFVSQGITTLEIKSGYGLNFENETKLLRVIKTLDEITPIDIIPTFLGAHSIPPEMKGKRSVYLKAIIEEMLPYIAQNELAVFCDGFCESTAFTPDEINAIFNKAEELELKLKLHTDQFNSIGGLDVALKHNAVSVDHLEVISENDVKKFSDAETAAVLLPGVSFFLDYDYAPARKLIDNNAIVALSTDYNPGSSHIANMNLIMSLASIKMKMTIEEVISAVTINAAKALDLAEDRGSIEIGKNADFAVFDTKDYSDIIYNVGKNLNLITIKSGSVIYRNPLS